MAKNPYEKGTIEYLDWATEQHDKATSPKTKTKKTQVKKKVQPKKKSVVSSSIEDEKRRKERFSGGLAGMLFGK